MQPIMNSLRHTIKRDRTYELKKIVEKQNKKILREAAYKSRTDWKDSHKAQPSNDARSQKGIHCAAPFVWIAGEMVRYA